MQCKEFPILQEKIYFEELENGLKVYLLPKPGFNKTYATFTTHYGSIDHEFVPLNQKQMKRVPDGIAHFLEHKLFEKEDYDVFEKFSHHSAAANAFTSFGRTSYLFSCTSDLKENLTTLIDFVQTPHFTEEAVEKEKGIIEQEIKMYQDDPDFKAYFGIINNLFQDHPVKIDIAGTVASIKEITAELLDECYQTFYHPSNMLVFVIGSFNVEDIMELIRQNQAVKEYERQGPIPREYPIEVGRVLTKERTEEMEIQAAKVYLGIKDPHVGRRGKELLKAELMTEIIFDLIFGRSSAYYQKMLHEGIINESFSYETTFEPSFGFSIIGGDSRSPDQLATNLHEKLMSIPEMTFDQIEFNRIKHKKMGRFLSALNSVEFIANQFTHYAFNGIDLFSIPDVLEEITLEDLHQAAKEYFVAERISTYKLVPKE